VEFAQQRKIVRRDDGALVSKALEVLDSFIGVFVDRSLGIPRGVDKAGNLQRLRVAECVLAESLWLELL
jgi:hypothetical protein